MPDELRLNNRKTTSRLEFPSFSTISLVNHRHPFAFAAYWGNLIFCQTKKLNLLVHIQVSAFYSFAHFVDYPQNQIHVALGTEKDCAT